MHALCTPPHRTPRSERGLRQWFESGVASLCAATADAQVHKSGGTPLAQGSRLMRDMGTESELSSALLSANGALCAAIGQAGHKPWQTRTAPAATVWYQKKGKSQSRTETRNPGAQSTSSPENQSLQRLRQAWVATPLSAAAEGPRWRGRASASSGYDLRPDFRRLVPSLRSSWGFSSGFTPYEWTPVNAERARVHSRCRNGDGRVHDAVLVEQQRCLSASTAAAVALLPPLPWRHFVRPLGLPRRPGTKSKRLPVRESFAPDRWDMCSTSCAANVPGRRRGQGCACCGRLARPGPVGNMSCPYTSALT